MENMLATAKMIEQVSNNYQSKPVSLADDKKKKTWSKFFFEGVHFGANSVHTRKRAVKIVLGWSCGSSRRRERAGERAGAGRQERKTPLRVTGEWARGTPTLEHVPPFRV